MSEEQNEGSPKYAKGDALAIVQGKSDVGVRGTIFWTGKNKYGPGFRYGLKDDGGATYWVDEADLGSPEGAPPPPPAKPRSAKAPLEKGAQVEITGGRDGLGAKGEVFWTGDSKFGQGMRYGVKTVDGTTYWVDEDVVTELASGPKRDSGAKPSSGPASSRPSSTGPNGGSRDAGDEYSAAQFRDDQDEFRDDFHPAQLAGTTDVDPESMPEAPPLDDAPFDDDDFRDDDGFDDDLPF